MSVKKAQKIVNDVEKELGFSLVRYKNSDLEFLRDKLDTFLDLEIETEELADVGDQRDVFGLDEIEDDEEELEE